MSRIPRPLPGCDILSLPLKPAEAYVLSRIDSSVDERELSTVTGLAPSDVSGALDRLHALGAIDFVGQHAQLRPLRHPTPMPASGAPEPRRPTPPATPAAHAAPFGRSAVGYASASPPLYDPAELDEDVEVDPDKRRRILDLFYRLDDFTYYELLGVADDAEKKQVKSAYYLIAPEFHPDKFFRKRLGSYKHKIETLFTRITLAHDVLTNKQRRGEYDDYLEQTHRNRTMTALLERTNRDIAVLAAAVDESAAATATTPEAPSPSPGRYLDMRPPETAQSRRETLARKLVGGVRRVNAQAPAGSGEGLRARYENARAEAKKQQVSRFLESGKVALERKDYAAAANAYRIASSLVPDDVELARQSAEVTREAAVALASGYVKQAEYEASYERWHEASLSYAKAATGLAGNARVHERVAYATLKSSGNARRAIEYARRAVELSPKEAEFHVTLARAYFAAGLEVSAQGELDRALELAPKDNRIRELVRLARQEPQPKDGKVG